MGDRQHGLNSSLASYMRKRIYVTVVYGSEQQHTPAVPTAACRALGGSTPTRRVDELVILEMTSANAVDAGSVHLGNLAGICEAAIIEQVRSLI